MVFNEEQIKAICDIYHGWQTYTEMEPYDKPELYHAASIDEIEANGWSLTTSRYIQFNDKSPVLASKMIVDETNQIVNDIQSQMNFFDSSFKSMKNLPLRSPSYSPYLNEQYITPFSFNAI